MKKCIYSFFPNIFVFRVWFFVIDLVISNSILNLSDKGASMLRDIILL